MRQFNLNKCVLSYTFLSWFYAYEIRMVALSHHFLENYNICPPGYKYWRTMMQETTLHSFS